MWQKVKNIAVGVFLLLAGFGLGAILFFRRGNESHNTGTGADQQSAVGLAEEARADNTRITEIEQREADDYRRLADAEQREADGLESAIADNRSIEELNRRSAELIQRAKVLLGIE